MTNSVRAFLVGSVLLCVVLTGIGVLVATTELTATSLRLWVEAVGGVLAAAAAIIVALLGFRAQRLTAQEVARDERAAAAEAAEEQRKRNIEMIELAAAREDQRRARDHELSQKAEREAARRGVYQDLLGWAHHSRKQQVAANGLPELPADLSAGALAMASRQVLDALQTFQTDPSERTYSELLHLIRVEMGADEQGRGVGADGA